MQTVYLGLGTNLGDRRRNLEAAIQMLAPRVLVEVESRIYETPAWGYKEQPDFLNMVVKAQTDLPPSELLAHLKTIEGQLGRTETFRWGPRLIDIDILFYDELILQAPELVIPHAHLHERAFVLVPLRDIAPDLVHPGLRKNIRELCAEVDASGIGPA